jgi:glyoxylase-like metal-dependent hydrolase (beta-lactamase superfamily II)
MKILDTLFAFVWRDMTENNCNTYVIHGTEKILVDPGHSHLFHHVKDGLSGLDFSLDKVGFVVVTHGHPDHLEAVREFGKPTLVAMSEVERQFIARYASLYPVAERLDALEPDLFLQEGDLTIGKETFLVIATPGHSPGSICLYWPKEKVLFTGDLVFSGGGIGRTDLPGGNGKQLKESIEKLAILDVEYLLPGHGDVVIGKEAVAANFQMIESQWFGYLI